MTRMVSFDGAGMKVLTLVYAYVDGKVLMLERAPTKAFLPGWFVAPGGKVEPGEDVLESGAREFFEETGMQVSGLKFKGSYTYFSADKSNQCGVNYIFLANQVTGTFKAQVEDGTLHWMTVEEILAHDKIMCDHKEWLKQIFTSPDHFACVASWNGANPELGWDRNVEWADSRAYFEGLAKAA